MRSIRVFMFPFAIFVFSDQSHFYSEKNELINGLWFPDTRKSAAVLRLIHDIL